MGVSDVRQLTYTVAVTDIYGGPHVPYVPKGYEFTGEFRPVTGGELYATPGGYVAEGPLNYPRLLVRKVPTKFTFELTGESRPPKAGEWFRSSGSGSFLKASFNYVDTPCEIARLTYE
jgi:hypothetical protein